MNREAKALPVPSNAIVSMAGGREIVPGDYDGGESRTDLKSIESAFLRNRWLMLSIVVASLGAGAATWVLSEPMYRAEATIEIAPGTGSLVAVDQKQPNLPNGEADRALQTQLDVLKSRSTAASVVDRLNLTRDATFLRENKLDPRTPQPVLAAQAAEAVQRGLTVSQPLTTRIIKLSYESSRPEFAAAAANGYADAFIADSFKRREQSYAYARTFLSTQVARAKARLEGSERALLSYARSVGLVDASGAAGMQGDDGKVRSLTKANMVDLNAAYAQARTARIQAQQRWAQAQSTPAMSLPEVLSNPAIQTLTQRRAELEATYQEERQRHQPDHPAIIQAQARIREMDRQIGSIAGSIRQSIGDQYRVAARQEASLQGNVGQLKGASFAEEAKGIRYNILKREADSNRNLYNTLLDRFQQVATQAADTKSDINLVDRAEVPGLPSSPKPLLILALAAVGGIFAALLTLLWKTRSDDRLHSPVEVQSALQVPLLGVVPRIAERAEFEHAVHDSTSILAEAHHAICINLRPLTDIGGHGVLLFTSSAPNEGKTTTAVQMATVMAQAGRKVLLIDGDIRRPSLHRVLGGRNDSGLCDLIAEGASEDSPVPIQYCEERGFAFLAAGSTQNSPAALFAGQAFALILGKFSASYDAVLIDGPPVVGLADAPQIAALADATMLVVEAGHAPRERCRMAIDRLAKAGAQQIGVIMAKYDPSLDRVTDGYAYNYEYGVGTPRSWHDSLWPWPRHGREKWTDHFGSPEQPREAALT